MSYSQFDQDDFVLDFFNNKKEGYFIDVGANVDGDDTKLLEELGWNGICIEPHSGCYSKLIECRKCICENVCVGHTEKDEIEFSENEGYTEALSGVLDYYCEEHKQRISNEIFQMGGAQNVIKKRMVELTSLLEKHNSPKKIDYLKVDVEGGEYNVFLGLDFSKYSFNLIQVEANYQHEIDRVVSLLEKNNYTPFEKVGIDIMFKPKEFKITTGERQ